MTSDIQSYLKQHEHKELLRFLTCGSVDDGKSTLIGRLLHDSQGIYEDQLAALKADSARFGTTGDNMDLALLVDGLQSEREQGITIDVAYRYFSTDRRKFIIADTPGHEQYTRNMVTGASTADAAVILIDARHGVLTQTRRHSFIASLLGIRHVIIAVNNMDLVGYAQSVFAEIQRDYREFASHLGLSDVHFVPISALKGDNVVNPGEHMPWYGGETLLRLLETLDITGDDGGADMRFPVQYVSRPNPNFRGYCGTVASGIVREGDEVMVLPSRKTSRVKSIVTYDGGLHEASYPLAVTLTLEDELDISRGDLLAHPDSAPSVGKNFDATVVWMSESPMLPGKLYDIKMGPKLTRGIVEKIHHRVDVNTLEPAPASELGLNEIALCQVALTQLVPFDLYADAPHTGSLILIDRLTNATAGAGMIAKANQQALPDSATNVVWHRHRLGKPERANQKGQKPCVLWFTGLSGSGKSTLSNALEYRLFQLGYHSYLLDGDNIRHGLNRDLGFSDADRVENIRRIGEAAALFVDAGLIVLTAFISPFRSDRQLARELLAPDEFLEIYVNTPLAVCEQRDPKGLYAKARLGQIENFTGVDSPYELPNKPEITLYTERDTVEECVAKVVRYLRAHHILAD